MIDRPIIFSGESVLAILEGRKTQTRRVLRQPVSTELKLQSFASPHDPMVRRRDCWWKPNEWSPYGVPGDRLWVRESFVPNYFDDGKPAYRADWTRTASEYIKPPKWQSPLFMSRNYSRLTLEIVRVRVERLKDISEADAIAEGMEVYPLKRATWSNRQSFALLWEDLNAKRGYSWNSNPWVWVVEFKRDGAA